MLFDQQHMPSSIESTSRKQNVLITEGDSLLATQVSKKEEAVHEGSNIASKEVESGPPSKASTLENELKKSDHAIDERSEADKSVKNAQPSNEKSMEFKEMARPSESVEQQTSSFHEGGSYQDQTHIESQSAKRKMVKRLFIAFQQNFRYPLVARKKGLEGIVLLAVNLSKDGVITDVRVLKGSGYRILDKAAVRSMKETKLVGWQLKKGMSLEVPVHYRLVKHPDNSAN